MNLPRVSIGIIIGSLALAMPLLAQETSFVRGSLRNIFPSLTRAERALLRDAGELTNFYSGAPNLRYRPNIAIWDELETRLGEGEPAVGIEVLFLYSLPDGWSQRPDAELTIYNTLRSVSTMQGILYFSASRGRMRTFYRRSYAIDDPDRRRRVADPLVTTIPDHERIYILQEDLSFGENIYSVDYRHQDGVFVAEMVNLTTMHYAIFPVVQPRGVDILLTIIPTDEGILFYGTSGVEVLTLLGLEERARASFTNRIRALYNWFREQIGPRLRNNPERPADDR